jgi:hypothetical protein
MAQRSAQVRLAPSPQSAARARHFIARTLAAWQGLTGAAETAVLLTSELVTNEVAPISRRVGYLAPANEARLPADSR